MRLWVAVAVLDGRVVRLTEGRPETAHVYSEDPVAVARRWIAEGADGLHVIDLDAALGRGNNRGLICEIARHAGSAEVQVGGGIRDGEDALRLFEAGAKRVVIGSMLVSAPESFLEICRRYPRQVLAGIDARDREVRIAGWTEGAAIGIEDAVLRAHALGAAGVVVTDISREGHLGGPNVELFGELMEHFPGDFEFIVSGGIATADDLVVLKVLGGVNGAVLGRPLYEGRIELRQAVERLAGRSVSYR